MGREGLDGLCEGGVGVGDSRDGEGDWGEGG